MAYSPLVLTLDETRAVLARLEPRVTLSARQLRYWDTQGVLRPARAAVGVARLYDVEDVALLRVALRLLSAGVAMQQVGAALKYRGAEIRQGLQARRAQAVVFDRGIASVVPRTDAASDALAVVDLRACRQGVEAACRAQRARAPLIWNGWARVAASEVRAQA